MPWINSNNLMEARKRSCFRRKFLSGANSLLFFLCLVISCLSARSDAVQNQQDPLAGASTTVQLPTLGVEIDANGVLSLSVTDPTGKIRAERAAVARRNQSRDIQKNSDNRKISLRRLSAAVSKSLDQNQELATDIVHLAGLRRLEHVFLYREDNDIIISGPAGGWFEEPSGRVVGLDVRQPLVLLDDLVTAIRAFGPSDPLDKVVLCSIDPTAEGLERYKKLKREMPIMFSAAEWAELPSRMSAAVRESLGPSNVRVQGVAHSSHVAQIMVESDYRMKMIGVGLEPEPVSMVTFIEAIDRPIGGFQQWWLRPKYDRLVQDPEALSLKIIGQTIELITGRLELSADKRLIAGKNRSSSAANKYATEFSNKYSQIAVNCPVFAQLQTVSDLLVVAGWLRKTDAWRRVGWDGGVFFDGQRLSEKSLPVPKTAQCVANAVTKGDMLVTPVGGGFSITPAISLDDEYLEIDRKSNQFEQLRKKIAVPETDDQWWWD